MSYILIQKNKQNNLLEGIDSAKKLVHWKATKTFTPEELRGFNKIPVVNETTGETIFVENDFISAPKESTTNLENLVIIYSPTEKKSYYVKLEDIPNLKEYKNSDNTIRIEGDSIYLNTSNVRFDDDIVFNENSLPLEIDLQQEYSEITSVNLNGLAIHPDFYRLNSKSSLTILESVTEVLTNSPQRLYIIVSGIKFFN